MIGARKRWSIGILLVAAGVSFWAARWLTRDRREAPPPPAARSDYSLQSFDLLVMNSTGLPSFRVQAPYLEKSPTDQSLSLDQPQLWLFDGGRQSWEVRAARGWIGADGEQVVLLGQVELDEQGDPGLSVQTSELTLFPETRTARSEVAVDLRQRGMQMNGVGLDADLKARRFEILSQVRGHYDSK